MLRPHAESPHVKRQGQEGLKLHTCALSQERLFVLQAFPSRRQARCDYV